MRTSNKLLLGFALGALLLLCSVHLFLYGEYKQGKWSKPADLHALEYQRFGLPAPKHLFLTGTIWVNIIPSDSFYIEIPRNDAAGDPLSLTKGDPVRQFNTNTAAIQYRQSGDSLIVTGGNDAPIHRPFADWYYRYTVKQINIGCATFPEISLHKGQLYLKGAADPGRPFPVKLNVDSSTVWIGFYQEQNHPAAAKEFFDSLSIRSNNSILLLNTAASIHSFRADLDYGSEIDDQLSFANSLFISYSADSRINLNGNNLKRTQLTAH